MRPILTIVFLICSICVFAQTELQVGDRIASSLETGQSERYQVQAEQGEFLKLIVQQQGIDLLVRVLPPEELSAIEYDSPNGAQGPEMIDLVVERSGVYTLEVLPLGEMPKPERGDYTIEFSQRISAVEYAAILQKEKEEEAALADWLQKQALPIRTSEAGTDYEDLLPLKAILENKRVIGLGEATHGTREFFQLKHRLLEFLIKELGYNIFAIEASYSRCHYINDYVLHGRGSLDTAVAIQGFWTWRTEEVREMIEWLREYNAPLAEQDKVQFVGYDLQVNDAAVYTLRQYLEQVGARRDDLDTLLQKVLTTPTIFAGSTELSGLIYPLEKLLLDLVNNQGRYEALSSPAAYASALQHARVLYQYVISYSSNPYLNPQDTVFRDYYMAENILYWLGQSPPDSKMVVWAHNGHVIKDTTGPAHKPLMGYFLAEVLGDAYYAIGFDFYEGKFQSRNMDLAKPALEELSIGPAPEGNLSYYLAQTPLPIAFVDFTQSNKSSLVDRLLSEKEVGMFSIGSGFLPSLPMNNWIAPTRLARAYDGLLFFRATTRARPLDAMSITRYRLE